MKSKKLIAVISLVIVVAMLSVMIAACNPEAKDDIDPQIYAIYELYCASAKAAGEEPLSYDAWYAQLLANAKGEKGDKGDQGAPGDAGKDGASWHTGEGAPAASLGKAGDLYFDTVSCDIYVKVADAWTKIANIKGSAGEQGAPGGKGEDGAPGKDGKPGRGIDHSAIEADGHLWIYYTDGTSEDLGAVRNPSNLVVKTTFRGEVIASKSFHQIVNSGYTYYYDNEYAFNKSELGISDFAKLTILKNGSIVNTSSTYSYQFTDSDIQYGTIVTIEYRWDDYAGTWSVADTSSNLLGFLTLDGNGNGKLEFNDSYTIEYGEYVDDHWVPKVVPIEYEDEEFTYTLGGSMNKPIFTYAGQEYNLNNSRTSYNPEGAYTDEMVDDLGGYYAAKFVLYRLDSWFGTYNIVDEDGFTIGTLIINGKSAPNPKWSSRNKSNPAEVKIMLDGASALTYSYNFKPVGAGIVINLIDLGSGGYRDSYEYNDNPPSDPRGGIGYDDDGNLMLYTAWSAQDGYSAPEFYKLVKSASSY